MNRKIKLVVTLASLLLLAAVIVGCGNNQTSEKGENKNITLGYVAWDSEIASTHVVKEILENKLGYKVDLKLVDAAPMWQGIASGDFDAIVSAWLPVTHEAYYVKVKDQVENLGANLEGAKIGLVVPTYVNIDSIADLNTIKDQLDGRIVGIEPGAGVMRATENAIKEYNLDLALLDSSSAAMTAELANSVQNNQFIAVTGWTPHWKFLKFDLKYLEDPKSIYGGEEHIATIVRQGLKDDNPEVYDFLDKFYWEPADMEAVMLKIEEGMSPEQAAKEWVENNGEKVGKWL